MREAQDSCEHNTMRVMRAADILESGANLQVCGWHHGTVSRLTRPSYSAPDGRAPTCGRRITVISEALLLGSRDLQKVAAAKAYP